METWQNEVMSVEELARQSEDIQKRARRRLTTILAQATKKSPQYIKKQLEKKP